jgi:hypothetical protein
LETTSIEFRNRPVRARSDGCRLRQGYGASRGDLDGDGFTSLQEFGAGTDPLKPGDVIGITDTQSVGSDVQIRFRTVLGKGYLIEGTDNFPSGVWSAVANNVLGTGGVVQILDLNGGAQPKWFYRVQVLPQKGKHKLEPIGAN